MCQHFIYCRTRVVLKLLFNSLIMSNYSIVLRTCFRNINDAIKLYMDARHQNGTPFITNISGIRACSGSYIIQENGHQRELNIVAHVVNSGLYSNKEIAEVVVLGDHQKRMPNNFRPIILRIVALYKPWIVSQSISCFQDIIDYIKWTIEPAVAAKCNRRSIKKWFGPLLKYDMALRIAYAHSQATNSTQLLPTDVYLYQGAQIGADKLLGNKPPEKMPASAIHPALANSGLNDEEIEDFLCVMHPFLALNGIKNGEIAEVITEECKWEYNNILVRKIKRNYPVAQMDILKIKSVM